MNLRKMAARMSQEQRAARKKAKLEQIQKDVIEMADIWEKKNVLTKDNPETLYGAFVRVAFERQTESLYEGDFAKYASGDYVNEVQQYQWEGFRDGWNTVVKKLLEIRNYCDRQCKSYPHKTAENYAYWDIQDKIDTMFGRQEKL